MGTGIIAQPDAKQLRELVSRRHPSYAKRLDEWEFLRLTFEGGKSYLETGNLWQYEGENSTEYLKRRRMTAYINYVKEIVGERANLIFSSPATYEAQGAPDTYGEFLRNTDGQRAARTHVMRRVYTGGSLYGTLPILVDKHQAAVRTVQDQIDTGAYPYLVLYRPQDMLDWSFGRNGFNWVLFRESERLDDDPFARDEKKVRETYLLYTRDAWYRIEATAKSVGTYGWGNDTWKIRGRDDLKMTASGANPLGEVPVVIYRDMPSLDDPVVGELTMLEAASLSREIFNLRANVNYQIWKTVSNILVVKSRGGLRLLDIPIGSDKAAQIAETGDLEWLRQEVAGIQEISAQIMEKERSLYRRAKMRDAGTAQDLQRVAAGALMQDSNSLYKELQQDVQELHRVDSEIDRLFALWEETEFQSTISYPKTFNVRGETELLNIVNTGKDILPGMTLTDLLVKLDDLVNPGRPETERNQVRAQAEETAKTITGARGKSDPLIPVSPLRSGTPAQPAQQFSNVLNMPVPAAGANA